MKILLISGHGDGDPGASSKFGVEATETVVMVQKIKETYTRRTGTLLKTWVKVAAR